MPNFSDLTVTLIYTLNFKYFTILKQLEFSQCLLQHLPDFFLKKPNQPKKQRERNAKDKLRIQALH